MNDILIILSAVSLALSVALLIVVLSQRKREQAQSAEFEESLFRLSEDEQKSRGELKKELSDSIRLLSEMLSSNQRTAAEAQSTQLKLLENRFSTFESVNEQKLDAMRDTIAKRLSYIQEDSNKRLEQIRVTVDEKLQKTLDDKMQLVSTRLEEVYKGLGEMQALANGVGDLKKVLSNVKARGILGEIQLEAILKEILSPEQYETDIAVIPGSKNRVEFAIRLPGEGDEPVFLPIDAKFPGDAYAALQDAYDTGSAEAVNAAYAALAARLKAFAKDIRDKYIEPPYTTSFGIMFLPFEGLYAEVVNRGLLETLQREFNVNIAGPSTMAALLNSLQMGFKTLAIQKRSNEVWQVLGAVKSEFDKFATALERTQDRLNAASKELDALVGVRTRAINRKLRSVEKLEDEKAEEILSLAALAEED
ncbi:MAG: DNA recombination protein RmuC [Christensenellales bacterium]|jgi:DNA recombination protein RmuC